MTPHKATVLIADLVTSRKVQDRAALHTRLESILEELGQREDSWTAPLVPVKGIDELSGVLARPWEAWDLALRVNLAIWPQRFRFALAAGTIDVAYETGQAPAMDGTAFHRAADALARARAQAIPFALAVEGLPEGSGATLEALLAMHAHLVREWTPREAEAVLAYRRHDNQKLAADELGVSQQAVSDALRRASHGLLVQAEEAVRQQLREIFGSGV